MEWPLDTEKASAVDDFPEVTQSISCISETEIEKRLSELVSLIRDSVNGGAAMGFLAPLSVETAQQYWRETISEIANGERLLFVIEEGDTVLGSVQLALSTRQNGRHRAEVQKLLVHSKVRNRGIARALMQEMENCAIELGRTLLVLDTQQGSVAETAYERFGYTRVGVIPDYAESSDHTLHNTVIFYKSLKSDKE